GVIGRPVFCGPVPNGAPFVLQVGRKLIDPGGMGCLEPGREPVPGRFRTESMGRGPGSELGRGNVDKADCVCPGRCGKVGRSAVCPGTLAEPGTLPANGRFVTPGCVMPGKLPRPVGRCGMLTRGCCGRDARGAKFGRPIVPWLGRGILTAGCLGTLLK